MKDAGGQMSEHLGRCQPFNLSKVQYQQEEREKIDGESEQSPDWELSQEAFPPAGQRRGGGEEAAGGAPLVEGEAQVRLTL